MYNVSNAYKAAVYSTPIYAKLAGTIMLTTGQTIQIYDNAQQSNVVKGSVTVKNQCVSKNKLELGCAYVGELDISLYNDIDQNTLYGGVITLSWYLKTDVSTYEEIPLGVYIIAEAVRTRSIIKITAYDKMQLLDADFISTETAGTVYEVLTYIAQITGIELAQTEEEIEALVNGDRYLTVTEGMDYTTYRDIVSDIATLLCCFATMTRDGKLKFVPFAIDTTEIISAGQRNSTNIAEIVVNYDSIKLEGKKATYTVVKTGQEIGTKLFNIGYCPVISQNHQRDYIIASLQHIIDNLALLNYTPTSCNIVGNPALDLGDMIEITTGANSAVYAPLMSFSWKYHGAMMIKALGDSTITGESRTQRIATGTADAVANNEIVIFTYENARDYEIGADFKQIIRINFTSGKATKGIFQGQFYFTCTADATVTIRYVFNNVTDLNFTPTQDVKAGAHIVTLFYPLNAIVPNIPSSIRVQMSISAGSATIEPLGIKAALSAQGLDNNVPEWDGTIELTDEVTPITVEEVGVDFGFTDSVTAAVQTPLSITLSESFTPITIEEIGVITLEDTLSVTTENA